MKSEQQRITIAEACGWKWHSRMKGSIKVWDNGLDYVFSDSELPDYLNDLNALHKAEKILDANQWDSYRKNLAREWTTNDDDGMWAAINTTAAQRAKAFLRTLNLWKP